ncbi:MAG: hypothetical protein A2Z14_09010 [Chloroflexi bacterium RBG_16_48_8]|nr:MAG: hypothetical protein A2Z14_09010 [Chloroflexi bacterium RBG_16_48_8]
MVFPAGFSPDRYWNEFEVRDSDLDFIYNLLLEREVPLTTLEMAEAIIGFRLEQLESEASKVGDTKIDVYLPLEKFVIGQRLLFPLIGNKVGKVVGVRSGENPSLGEFDVIEVEFEDGDRNREFAAQLGDHKLNLAPESTNVEDETNVPNEILLKYGDVIQQRLTSRLEGAADIVRIAGRWFPKALLTQFHEGHLNLAEAVLDIAEGGPTATSELLRQLDIPSDHDSLLAAFSLDYALQEDERFDEVGPAGQILWHLKRLEPPEVLYPPPRLNYDPELYERTELPEALTLLERELNDELSSIAETPESKDEVIISLLFPHWRVGTLPLSSKLKQLFPTAYESPRIRFVLIDGHSGNQFTGWVVRKQRYVFGLDEWYRKYDIPAGGLIRIRRGEKAGEVIVEAIDRRRRNDWIRTVSIGAGGRIGFTMLKQPVGTAYDDLMVVGLIDPIALDEAWLRGNQREMPLDRLVAHVFRELAKLNPQSAVHAQSLYSGVNVIRRLPPAPIFTELSNKPYYVHVGDLYWRFNETAWSQM